MVALATPARAGASVGARRSARGWAAAAAAVLVVGLGLRLVLGAGGVGDRSAAIMATLLCLGAWLVARLLSSPRIAFGLTLVLVALFDVAALPARNAPEYDAREAFYRPDQVLQVRLAVPPTLTSQSQPILTLVAEPIFPASASQPAFALAGAVNGVSLVWDCQYQHSIQHLTLPVPLAALMTGSTADVQLHLSGAPNRDSDYLLVYLSAQRGGFLVGLTDSGAPNTDQVSRCSLRS